MEFKEVKDILKELQQKLKETQDIKVSQEQLMFSCVEFCARYFNQFVREEFPAPAITPEKLNQLWSLISQPHKGEKTPDKGKN